ncbi:phospholipase D-like domain-containing protein DpdK [Marinobacter adhaerens]|jgi:phosphatidylserine/phosphatidylglycerophosphate/cardiolipin synthase-like enzyme|uniref:phospholipase D-like domain-containing protein DpdK n=1 Tax=Marinobacter adhaerens TaxID=1033846 RepID=UPI001C59887D|nr:phospholipase D-like domain-containing protein DpdK [Marinobacter adhaerens]MBW3225285.1 phospholipase D family protein [Marinobacter adhaerens]
MNNQRQIFLHGPLGQRQFREVLGAQLAGLIIKPEPIWLVSPWLSDFPLLDNRAGEWDALNPSWGSREISFNEVLACAVNEGCVLRLVTKDDPKNASFINHLKNRLLSSSKLYLKKNDPVHTKGLLTRHFFLKGSMNYTFSGANRNDEHLILTSDKDLISEAFIEFNGQYQFEDEG